MKSRLHTQETWFSALF